MDFRNNTVKKCRNESINGRLFWIAIVELVPSTPSVTQLLNIYLKYVHLDMYICSSVLGWNYISDDEARLILNVINQEHNNFAFGKERFLAIEDYIVSLEDVHEFYTFINVCYFRLLCKKKKGYEEKCGFIQIDNFESIVPYCIIDNQKYVPLFYFKNNLNAYIENLMHGAIQIENWNLAYLKFCSKIQGIRDELFPGNSCTVVSLDNIKKYFPSETQFEDYWPHETLISHLPINQNSHLPINQNSHFPINQNSHLPINQNSHFPINQNSHLPINQNSHFPINQNSHLPINQNSSTNGNLQGAWIRAPPQAEPAEFTEDPITGCGCSDEEMDLAVIVVSPRQRRSLWSRTKRLFQRMSCCGALINPTNKVILVGFLPYITICKNEIVDKWCFK
ncbi:uncharacterized protein LOC132946715 [Metopolophium dirhodum]|uniref:uncharacterized protein LOC132946715 n=1 Tax=Metopolophium dirhodum TaxID=44670 RepID=UPI0029905F6D|nr:uncharacterized protein LOC132946715 [Metopolophium dirhodum]